MRWEEEEEDTKGKRRRRPNHDRKSVGNYRWIFINKFAIVGNYRQILQFVAKFINDHFSDGF